MSKPHYHMTLNISIERFNALKKLTNLVLSRAVELSIIVKGRPEDEDPELAEALKEHILDLLSRIDRTDRIDVH